MDRHFKRLVLIPAIFSFGAALLLYSVIVCAGDSKIPKGQPDLTTLGLKVTDVEIVDEITQKGVMGEITEIKAKDDYKLVVITLEGRTESDGWYTFIDSSFAVFYECKNRNKYRSSTIQQDDTIEEFTTCCAIKTITDWSIRPKGAVQTTIGQSLKAGPVKLKVAAIIPDDVTSCRVVIPAVASGQAVIPSSKAISEIPKPEPPRTDVSPAKLSKSRTTGAPTAPDRTPQNFTEHSISNRDIQDQNITFIPLGFVVTESVPTYKLSTVYMTNQQGYAQKRVQNSDERILLVVMSIRSDRLMPSDEEYQAMKKEKESKGESISARDRIRVYDPNDFRLILGSTRAYYGQIIGEWESGSRMSFPATGGFGIHKMLESRELPLDPNKMESIAVGWTLNSKDCDLPLRISFDKDLPVPVPNTRFPAPRGR